MASNSSFKLVCEQFVRSSKIAQRQRKIISQKDKERLVRTFEERDQDCLALVDMLAINRSAASVIAPYLRKQRIEEKPRGGRRNVRFHAEMRRCLQRIVV